MAGLLRQCRRRDQLRIDGPAVIFVETGRPALLVRAAADVNIDHVRHKKSPTASKKKPNRQAKRRR